MSIRSKIDTMVAEANPITRETAAGLLPEEMRLRFLEAVVLESPEDGTRPRRGRRPDAVTERRPALRLAMVAVAICLVLTSLTLFTAPGQAVSSWVGDQIGLGDPGGHPTLHVMRARGDVGTSAEGRPAWVLAVGPAPHGGRYELITYWPRAPRRHLKNAGHGHWLLGKPCFELDLTQERDTFGEECGTFPEGPDLYLTMGAVSPVSEPALGRSSYAFFDGRVSGRAATVEAEMDGRPVPVEVKPVPEAFVRRFRLGEPFSFFIAFLPTTVRDGGRLTVTARRADGSALATRSKALPNFEVTRRASCILTHKALRRGIERRKFALRAIDELCGPLR